MKTKVLFVLASVLLSTYAFAQRGVRIGYVDMEYILENVEEYRRRSPAWQTPKFRNTPLLIHTNTNDDDVNVLEVEHLIKSLKADGKKFDYKIFKDIPGGHSFDRIDRKIANEIRLTIYAHLAKELRPPKQLKTLVDITEAAYLK